MSILLECGHTADSVDESGNAKCVICTSVKELQSLESGVSPELKGRQATCFSCGKTVESNYQLPLFKYEGNIQSAPKELHLERNKIICQLWNCKDETESAGLKENLERLNVEIKKKSMDSFYCGCIIQKGSKALESPFLEINRLRTDRGQGMMKF